LVLGVIAIAGLPPFGIFMSEFLIITSTFARQPLLAIPLVVGLLIGIGALVLRMQGLAFGSPTGASAPVHASVVPVFFHLAIVLLAGIFLPEAVVSWFRAVASMIG
jgi:hydrogenase-4 component F